MAISDIEIKRAAKQLLDIHGDAEAWAVAATRAVELYQAGDAEGFAVFSRIAQTLSDWVLVDPPARPEAQH